jgi:hypothetical protein
VNDLVTIWGLLTDFVTANALIMTLLCAGAVASIVAYFVKRLAKGR